LIGQIDASDLGKRKQALARGDAIEYAAASQGWVANRCGLTLAIMLVVRR
jgi:hypothetical protein